MIRFFTKKTVIILTAIVGVLLACLGFYIAYQWEYRHIEAEFNLQAENSSNEVRLYIDNSTDVLQALAAFFASSQSVTADEFTKFSQTFLVRHSGIKALLWMSADEQGVPQIRYLASPNDAGSKPQIKRPQQAKIVNAMQKALSLQEPYLALGLSPHPSISDYNDWVFMPVITDDDTTSFLVGIFDFKAIISQAIVTGPAQGVAIRIYRDTFDGLQFVWGVTQSDEGPQVLEKVGTAQESSLIFNKTFSALGSEWVLQVTPAAGYFSTQNSWVPWFVFIVSLAAAAFLMLYVSTLYTRTERIERIVRLKTRELREATESLEERSAALSHSNSELQKFAYAASHDLQEPLRTIASYTQLLERRYAEKFDESGREFLQYIVEGATRMRSLINDLLVYSRVESMGGKLTAVDLQKVLEWAIHNLSSAIEESAATIKHKNMPLVLGDEAQLRRLWQNLISNAIKYRSERPIEIDINFYEKDNQYIFSVQDNGIGIEPRFFERIFGIFQRLHGPGQYSGSGIGLAICQKIIQRHGGEIWLESEFGEGSTFYFTLRPYQADGDH